MQDVSSALSSSIASDAVIESTENHGQLIVRYKPAGRADVLAVLKSLGFGFYSFCCGVDWPEEPKMEVLDHVYCIERRERVTIRCDLDRSKPRLPTATGVYGGANWHERETWELFGIYFEGHPRLVRLLLPDWQEGYPMRKDFELAARIEKPWPGESFSG